jgi:uncharacterized protein YaeQ
VVVYTHTDAERYWATLAGERIHRSGAIEFYALDRTLIAAFVARLERRVTMELSVTDRVLYLTLGKELLTAAVTAHRLPS